ncbi:AAA family ATPase [Advenella sp. FME57]|uniref:AAA family ATPase n=1 Tax=Advenella sp. FME57 TaxID=2742604 RepID=UPI001866390F|nr:AAA family ATPase [Advenella sp. FME57]
MIEPSVAHGTEPVQQLDSEYTDHNVLPPTQATQGSDQYPRDTDSTNVAPAVAQPELPTFSQMKKAKRWLLASPKKIPYYINGQKRSGTLDSNDDRTQFASYDEAKTALTTRGGNWYLGFALGPDENGGHWQGIDLDDIPDNELSDVANIVPGYVEISPSGTGAHAIGYGRHFPTLGSNGTGIEAYAGGRFFTVTERPIRDKGFTCLANFIGQKLAPRYDKISSPALPATAPEIISVDAKTVTELRSALYSLRSDDYHLWTNMGMALRELGDVGRGLWLDWSATSEKYNAQEASRKWDKLGGNRSSYQSVFAQAQKHGWANPASNAARIDSINSPRKLVGRSLNGVLPRAIDWLWTGWIPKGYITIFAGETGAGKSTVLADITARVTTGQCWPGEFSNTHTRPAGRVLWLGSEDGIEEMTVPRLMACGANLHNVIEIQGIAQQGKRNTFSMQDDLDGVNEWLKSAQNEGQPFEMLVIDPVTSYLPGQKLRKVDLNDAGQLRTILEPWLALAQEHRIAIVCVTHFAKDTSRAMLHRVVGSAAFAQTCRSLCAVMEDPTSNDNGQGVHEKVLMQVKVNLPEHPGGAWKFRTEKVDVDTDPHNGKIITATRPKWDELDSALTPKSVVGSARGPVGKNEPAFGIWLKAQFENVHPGYTLPLSQIKQTALSAGFSERWWAEHSGRYIEKQNISGVWYCRPKTVS